ncbi:hypothetical protein BS640_18125 [Rouxiella badensis]|uniref:Uncharacterized protein n=1 Tax=Rouxiella badensis TaxID=1646377 RepID=A0A1X0WBF4_9GAMM|nr:hypothetical protein BS640_18125 [Rouxiella badensis]
MSQKFAWCQPRFDVGTILEGENDSSVKQELQVDEQCGTATGINSQVVDAAIVRLKRMDLSSILNDFKRQF